MKESYWIKPDGASVYAPQGHAEYIREHWQDHELPEGIELSSLIFNGWIRVSGETVVLQHVDNPIALEKLQQLLINLGHEQYTVWLDGRPYTVPLSLLKQKQFIEIYRDIVSGTLERVADASDAYQQGIFEQQPSWNEMNSDGSDAIRDKGVEWMAQDTTPEVRWKNQLLDYLRKNFPGKKDVMPPEPDIGYPSQAFNVVKRLEKKADSDVQDVIDRGYNLDDLVCRYCGSHEVVFNQGIGDASCQECGEWQLEKKQEEQEKKDFNWRERWHRRGSIKKAEGDIHVGDTVQLKKLKPVYGIHPDKPYHKRTFLNQGTLCTVTSSAVYTDGRLMIGVTVPSLGDGYFYFLEPTDVIKVPHKEDVRKWEERWQRRSSLKKKAYRAEDADGKELAEGDYVRYEGGHDYTTIEGYIDAIYKDNLIDVNTMDRDTPVETLDASEVTLVDREGGRKQDKIRNWEERWHKRGKKIRDTSIDKSIAIAGNPETPPQTLDNLSRDGSEYVRVQVAKNPNTVPETLINLTQDQAEVVRVHVAKNPNTPPSALQELAQDAITFIRELVVLNPSVSPETLYELSGDTDEQIREIAKTQKRYPGSKLRQWKEKWMNRKKVQQASLFKKAELTEEEIKRSILNDDSLSDVMDFEITDERMHDRSPTGGTFVANGNKYQWYASEDGAIYKARKRVREDLETQPEIFTQSWLQTHIDEDRWADELYSDINSMVYDSPESYSSFIDDSEPAGEGDEEGSFTDDQIERMTDAYMKDIKNKGVMNYMQHDLGYSGEDLSRQMMAYLDIEGAADDALGTDGWVHFMNSYDGESHETNEGVVYFKTEEGVDGEVSLEILDAEKTRKWEERWQRRGTIKKVAVTNFYYTDLYKQGKDMAQDYNGEDGIVAEIVDGNEKISIYVTGDVDHTRFEIVSFVNIKDYGWDEFTQNDFYEFGCDVQTNITFDNMADAEGILTKLMSKWQSCLSAYRENRDKKRRWEERWIRRGIRSFVNPSAYISGGMFSFTTFVSGDYPVLELIFRATQWKVSQSVVHVDVGEEAMTKGHYYDTKDVVVGILRDGVEAFTVLMPESHTTGEEEQKKTKQWEERWTRQAKVGA